MVVYRRKFEQYQDFIHRMLSAKGEFEGTLMPTNAPKTVTFQVTDTCNLACTYCYQINKGVNAMTFETAKKFIDTIFIDSYREGSYLHISSTPAIILEFIGGEPLLEINLIDQITDYFKYKAISENHPWATKYLLSMISNGVNYYHEDVQKYLTKNKGKVSFSISVDGCKELHDMCRVFPNGGGSYDLAESACLHYKKNYDDGMLTKMTIAPENIEWTYKAFENLLNLGYYYIHSNVVYEEGWDISHAKIFYKELKKVADLLLDRNLENEIYTSLFEELMFHPMTESDNQNYCGSTGCMIACDPKGGIYPCIRFMSSSLGDSVEPLEIGHIDEGIGVTDKHKAKISELNSVTRKSQSTDECYNCPIAMGCGWCSAHNYQVTGSINKRTTFICPMHKARALANTYYWNKVYKKNKEDKVFELHCPESWALEIISKDEYDMLRDLTVR